MPRINGQAQLYGHLFTPGQLKQFAKELQETGDIDEFMIQKKAIQKNDNQMIVMQYDNIRDYCDRVLVGVYQNLPIQTNIPFELWQKLHDAWRKQRRKLET